MNKLIRDRADERGESGIAIFSLLMLVAMFIFVCFLLSSSEDEEGSRVEQMFKDVENPSAHLTEETSTTETEASESDLKDAQKAWDYANEHINAFFLDDPTAEGLPLERRTLNDRPGKIRWVFPNDGYVETNDDMTISLEGDWKYWEMTFTHGDYQITLNNFKEEVSNDESIKAKREKEGS